MSGGTFKNKCSSYNRDYIVKSVKKTYLSTEIMQLASLMSGVHMRMIVIVEDAVYFWKT